MIEGLDSSPAFLPSFWADLGFDPCLPLKCEFTFLLFRTPAATVASVKNADTSVTLHILLMSNYT